MTSVIHQSPPLALHWVLVWLHGGPKLIGMSGGGGGGGGGDPGIHIGGPGGLGMGPMGADILQRGDQKITVFLPPESSLKNTERDETQPVMPHKNPSLLY